MDLTGAQLASLNANPSLGLVGPSGFNRFGGTNDVSPGGAVSGGPSGSGFVLPEDEERAISNRPAPFAPPPTQVVRRADRVGIVGGGVGGVFPFFGAPVRFRSSTPTFFIDNPFARATARVIRFR